MRLQVTEGKAYATVFPDLCSPPPASFCPPHKIRRLLFKTVFLKNMIYQAPSQKLWMRYRLHFPPKSHSRVSVFETLGSNQQWGFLREEPKFSNWF